jgi:Caspase domain
MKKLYALLIGINQYQNIRNLNACKNDVNKVQDYLIKKHGNNADIKTLIDSEATRNEIVNAFRAHLSQAKSGDTVFFYFSGHGVRQQANTVFRKDSLNGYIECITCHDTSLDGRNVLADKEIRWLIHELYSKTQCHIIVLFDSCHSGDATRGLEENAPVGDIPLKRMATHKSEDAQSRLPELILPIRKWSDFIFGSTVSETTLQNAVNNGMAIDTLLPQGKHIQLAASSSDEPAWEVAGTGLFTESFIQVLKATNEKITYYDFRSLAYQRLNRMYGGEKKNIRQAPQIYSYGESIFQPIFGGIVQQKGIEANLFYNQPKKQWEIDMGAIYGIPNPTDDNLISLVAQLDNEGHKTAFVFIRKVFSDYSVVGFDESEETRQKAIGNPNFAPPLFNKKKLNGYKCLIKKLLQKPIKVAYVGSQLSEDWKHFCKNNAALLDLASVIPVSNNNEADYVLNTEGVQIFVAFPTAINRPLIKQIQMNDSTKAFESILSQLEQISRWEFVKTHENKLNGSDLLHSITIDLSISKGQKMVANQGKVDVNFNFDCNGETYYSTEEINITLTNTSSERLYVAAAWLGERMGIDCTPIAENSVASPIEKDKSINLWGSAVPFNYQSYIKEFGWDKFSNFLKIYISDAPFNITLLHQLDMDAPTKLRGTEKGAGPKTEPIPVDIDNSQKVAKWAVKTVEFVVHTR